MAVGDLDIYNVTAKHIAKQAGLTPQERASFRRLLADAGLVDTFRARHPTAAGNYTYYSTRAGNRPYNRGLRLDYFLATAAAAGEGAAASGGGTRCPLRLHDAYILHDSTAGFSDHDAAVLEVLLT